MRKMMICPWFGQLPPWFDKYLANAETLEKYGYRWLITTNLKLFKERVGDLLGIDAPIVSGQAKVHDYRPALGLLFKEELEGYDFWGHTDFDCVYGKVDDFVPDEFLNCLDIHSNHVNYVCGPWTLYRNRQDINELFLRSSVWRRKLLDPLISGWAEHEFTAEVDAGDSEGRLRRQYTFWQGNPDDDEDLTLSPSGKLFQGEDEIMMFHGRRTKRWPPGVEV